MLPARLLACDPRDPPCCGGWHNDRPLLRVEINPFYRLQGLDPGGRRNALRARPCLFLSASLNRAEDAIRYGRVDLSPAILGSCAARQTSSESASLALT